MELINSSTALTKTLLPEEQKIIQVKYAAVCFGKMDKYDLLTVAKVLMLKLHVMTGWTLPADANQTILVDQFAKKLSESYANVNIEEVEYAFRNNPGVKDWGKAMNLSLIDEVMKPYLDKRLALSKLEESQSFKQPLLDGSSTTDHEFIESVKTLYSVDKNFRKIPVLAYKVLNIQLTREEKNQVVAKLFELYGIKPDVLGFQDLCKQYAVKLYFDELESGI